MYMVQGAMTQCQKALKPDGLFLAAMFGGETLQELRIAHSLAEQELEGGLSPRISPLAQVINTPHGRAGTRKTSSIVSSGMRAMRQAYKIPEFHA